METQSSQQRFVARLVLGLGQGLILYLLFSAYDLKTWPATEPLLFAPLTVVALFVPLLVSQALGNMRSATLLVWTLAATLILAGLSWYDVWHMWPGEHPRGLFPAGIVPTAHTLFICGLFLFVAHALVSCGDADRRIVAHYSTLFDLAWKLGAQAAIIVAFTAAFWIMLFLGIALFDMIKLTGFGHFIGHPWVWLPFTTIAAAAAIHITDARANLVRGVRTLALTLLGWLLPVIALLALAFLIALVFTGLQPLWQTRSATLLLMAAAAVLIIHINAAYQDGDSEHRPPHILRVAGTLAAVLLIFIVWIAATALWLRVDQYGWTVDRIYSAACVLVAAMFALGYLIAALLPGLWLKLIERWNVYGTFLFLAVLLALSTPLADPMRLAVASQVARLETGAVKPDKFDFAYLRSNGGRYGREALERLSHSTVPDVHDSVEFALNNPVVPRARTFSVDLSRLSRMRARPSDAEILAASEVYPKSKTLPETFVHQAWEPGTAPCRSVVLIPSDESRGIRRCVIIIHDFDGDGIDDLLVMEQVSLGDRGSWSAAIYRQDGKLWRRLADISMLGFCKGDYEALISGNFTLEPSTKPLPDIVINGDRVNMEPAWYARHCRDDGGPN